MKLEINKRKDQNNIDFDDFDYTMSKSNNASTNGHRSNQRRNTDSSDQGTRNTDSSNQIQGAQTHQIKGKEMENQLCVSDQMENHNNSILKQYLLIYLLYTSNGKGCSCNCIWTRFDSDDSDSILLKQNVTEGYFFFFPPLPPLAPAPPLPPLPPPPPSLSPPAASPAAFAAASSCSFASTAFFRTTSFRCARFQRISRDSFWLTLLAKWKKFWVFFEQN